MLSIFYLFAALFLFQVNVSAVDVDPIAEFISNHSTIAVEYRHKVDLNEETIRLRGTGQSVDASHNQDEIMIGISGPNGQENMRIITENKEALWNSLKNLVNQLRKESLARYENDENIETVLFNENLDCKFNGHTGYYKRISLIDKHLKKYVIGGWRTDQCSGGFRKALFIGNDSYTCSYEEIENYALEQRQFNSFFSVIQHNNVADQELQENVTQIDRWRNRASQVLYQRGDFTKSAGGDYLTVIAKDGADRTCSLGCIAFDQDYSGLARVTFCDVQARFGKIDQFDRENFRLNLLLEMVKDLKFCKCTTIVIEYLDLDNLSFFEKLEAEQKGKNSRGYWMRYDVNHMERALQNCIDQLVEEAF